jgi:hypothetical protein
MWFPVHPCWEGDVLWVLVGNSSVKSKNIAHNNHVAFHWQVTESGDGVEVWGTATLHSDVETKKRLWNGVFDYDLNAFAPGGPENSPDTGLCALSHTGLSICRNMAWVGALNGARHDNKAFSTQQVGCGQGSHCYWRGKRHGSRHSASFRR